LTSLSRLLDPGLVERVLEAYREKDGGEPKTYTIELGWKLLSIARQTGCLDQAGLDELDELRAGLEEYRQDGMTEKDLAVIRQTRQVARSRSTGLGRRLPSAAGSEEGRRRPSRSHHAEGL
jgi:hypothetical protein